MIKVAMHSSNLNQSPHPVSLLSLSHSGHVIVISQILVSVILGLKMMMLLFKFALFCAERKLKRRAAYQECPAQARRALHMHGSDTHRQRHSLRPAGCQR